MNNSSKNEQLEWKIYEKRKERADLISRQKTPEDKRLVLEILEWNSEYKEYREKHFQEKKNEFKIKQRKIQEQDMINGMWLSEEETKNSNDDFRSIITSRVELSWNNEMFDFEEVKNYIESNSKFKTNIDGSLILPNWIEIPNEETSNQLTKQISDYQYKSKNYLTNKESDNAIDIDSIKEEYKWWDVVLEWYSPINKWMSQFKKIFIDDNFPEDWDDKNKLAWLIYFMPRLFGNNHISFENFESLFLAWDTEMRWAMYEHHYDDYDEHWSPPSLPVIRYKKNN